MKSPQLSIILILVIAGSLGAQIAPPPPPPNLASLTINRDANAFPHIEATDPAAAWFGYGLAQMRDMPLTVARNLATSSAELALILGPGSPTGGDPFHIQSDLRTRLWRIEEIATRQIALMPNSIRRLLHAYAYGLEAGRIEWLANAGQLAFNTEPVAYDLPAVQRMLSRPITLQDVVNHGVYMNGITAMSQAQDLADSDDPNAHEDHIRTASNSFAIGQQASATGRPMTVADPHLGFENIGQLRAYFAQIRAGSQAIGGISFPGFPAIAMGFNEDFSWAITANNPDFVDVWHAPKFGNGGFLFDGAATPIIRQQVLIDVFDEQSGQITQVTRIRSYAGDLSRPIVRESGNVSIGALAGEIWYAGSTFDTDTSLWEFFIRLGQARNIDQAKAVFATNVILGYNFLCADGASDLYYIYTGRVPVRGAPTPGTSWSQVQDGTNSAYQWTSVHPFSDLPQEQLRAKDVEDLEQVKWLQCNVLPNLVRPDTKMQLSDFPDYMVHPDTTPTSWRQVRGRELLDQEVEPIGAANLRELAIDDLDLWWTAAKPLALTVMGEFRLWQEPELANMMLRLIEWDGHGRPEIAEPLMAQLIWAHYARLVQDLEDAGIPAGSYDDFRFPEEVPSVLTFKSRAWKKNRIALSRAIRLAHHTWSRCLNPLLPLISIPTSPWTPEPWSGLSTTEAVWGTAHYIDLTPNSSPLDLAAYPIAGGLSLLALSNTEITDPWQIIIEDVAILGQTGTLVNSAVDSGAHTLLQVELRNSGPVAYFLEAIGPSEVASDPDRYRYAPDFAAGNWRPFPWDLADIVVGGVSSQNMNFDLNLVDPTTP